MGSPRNNVIQNMPARRLSCAVGVCNNYYYKTKNLLYEGYPITYHYFPRNTNLCNRWIDACDRGEQFKTQVSFVCSIHFRPEDFTKQPTGSISQLPKRRLKCNVAPTRNLTLEEISSFASKNNWKKNNEFSYYQDGLEAINKASETKRSTMINNSVNTLDDELIILEKKFDKLSKDYEDLKKNSKMEIEKLKSIIKEKDELFPKKLRKILSEHLTETEIDLVLFLRKQKKELADS